MAKYTVTPPTTGFTCEHGSVTPEEDGTFVLENLSIVEAMRNHGLHLTEVVEPEPPAQPEQPEQPAQAKVKKAAKTDEAAALAAAQAAALAGGDTSAGA